MAASTETERAPGLYQELDASKNQIRLMTLEDSSIPDTLNIRCRLSVVSLYDDPTYIALSYAWGDPNITEDISVNNIPLPLTTNLIAALRRLYERYSDKQVAFWIDAICINQQDLGERGHQVKIMGQIYSRAQTVISWLGELHINISTLPGLFQEGTESTALLIQNRHAIQNMLNVPYWRRMWTQQEIILARDLLLLCGPSSLTADEFDNFRRACRWLLNNMDWTIPGCDANTRLELNGMKSLFFHAASMIYRTFHHHNHQPHDVASLFLMVMLGSRRLSSDPRDKLYALVGIDRHDQLGIEPDYTKSAATAYIEFVQGFAKKHSVLILNGSNGIGQTRSSQARIPGLPSWMPDFTYDPQYKPDLFFTRPEVFDSCGPEAEFSGDGLHLTAKGLVIDRVQHFKPSRSGTDLIHEWWSIVFRDEQDANLYPTGMPKVQAFFRTLIMADPDAGYGEDDDDNNLFFRLAFGFMMVLGVYESSPNFLAFCKTCTEKFGVTPEELKSAIMEHGRHVFGLLRSTGYVEHLMQACEEASGLRGIADMSEQKLLEGFCGHENQPGHLRWKKNYDPERAEEFRLGFLMRTYRDDKDGRDFFTTRKGYMGIGIGVKQGDIVCALYGGIQPLILRQVDGHYLVVSSCYVHGITGESVEKLGESGAFETRHFEMR